MTNLLSTVAFFAVVGGLAWLGWGLEPHWASKDGRRFMCRMQLVPDDVHERTRWHDVKVAVDDRELYVFSRSRNSRDLRGNWRVVGATNDDSARRRIYELRNANDDAASLRVPQRSRCVHVLDDLAP